MIRHVITIMGRQTAYWERNPHRPQTIVLLHGFRGNHKGLTDLAQHLDGYRLILPDLPGYGESELLMVPHTLRHYARWLDEFIAGLHLDDFVVWSHSYGGSIALIQAARGRVRPAGLVCVSLAAIRQDLPNQLTTTYYQFGRLLPYHWRQRWLASKLVDHMAGRWLFTTVTQRRREALVKRGDANLAHLDARVITEEYLSALNTRLEHYARQVSLPVLMIAGAKDVIVPVARLQRLARLMPHAKLVVMPDQGHLAPIERPGSVATLTKEFITRL